MLLDFSQGNMTFVVEVDENGRAMLRHFCNGPATDEREKDKQPCRQSGEIRQTLARSRLLRRKKALHKMLPSRAYAV